jgi:hypothetical protein
MSKLSFDLENLVFAPVVAVVDHNNVPPVTVRGGETAKGKRTAYFSILASLLEGFDHHCTYGYNGDLYLFRLMPEAGGYEFSPTKGKKTQEGQARVLLAVPWPANLPFEKARVGCGYELRAGAFYMKYPLAAGNNPDLNAPVRLTPIQKRAY